MQDTVVRRFREVVPKGLDHCTIRIVEETTEQLEMRRGVLQPVRQVVDYGAMITVSEGRGQGYAATSDLSGAGIRTAIERARRWARETAARSVFDAAAVDLSVPTGSYETPVQLPWDDVGLDEKVGLLARLSKDVSIDERIVDWELSLWSVASDHVLADVHGGCVSQRFRLAAPDVVVLGSADGQVQKRSTGGRGLCQQGGWEVLERVGFAAMPGRCAREVIELLEAPDCPSGRMHLLLDPGQMMLQIHESIGHPIELDRILGDERNYAGTSFVTPEMFGSYRYGSPLLNVTFDPRRPHEFARYGWDADGTPAERVHLIRSGILERPLGGRISQARAGLPGVANSRASSWNRPPIDRMANLNVEPGDQSLDALISQVERGVFLQTNTSWSIDDSRNKFQFGCELGRVIEDGELKGIVRNPNYRGISATFWRNLVGVGDASTFATLGTPFCGKGEPNQIIRVGHASPACLFADVDVFGGA
jgi:predicted Zn-dependent protease